ncbi:HAD domain-containing protein [Mucilaginibacter sp. SMC90]|uniref:HAD domain-containing protein n=1 Tax=Mucilaginibacter sp. SMC90 TaxID=2929803 RepID=UPI001FB2B949|nr:HAD domain-containing protein [Mucilaginibacter sp. SMC90]UOE49302.1 HAD domain-containing protein [Mucilaginibacter sp. SMC90]
MDDGFPVFNAGAVKALQRILAVTNASVILTTSRKLSYTIAEWRTMLKYRGVIPTKVQRLTTDSLKKTRAEEITEWYQDQHRPNQPFVIIDDDKMLNGLPEYIKSNLVLTSPSMGFTDDLANEAIAILKMPAYKA